MNDFKIPTQREWAIAVLARKEADERAERVRVEKIDADAKTALTDFILNLAEGRDPWERSDSTDAVRTLSRSVAERALGLLTPEWESSLERNDDSGCDPMFIVRVKRPS